MNLEFAINFNFPCTFVLEDIKDFVDPSEYRDVIGEVGR